MVYDPHLDRGVAAKACLFDKKHEKFLVSTKNGSCVHEMKPFLIHVFATQGLNQDSDINENERVSTSARTLLVRWKQKLVTEGRTRWKMNQKRRSTQNVLVHITNYTIQYYFHTDLYVKAKNIPCNQWPEVWYFSLKDNDYNSVSMHETYICEVAVKRSTISYSASRFILLQPDALRPKKWLGTLVATYHKLIWDVSLRMVETTVMQSCRY